MGQHADACLDRLPVVLETLEHREPSFLAHGQIVEAGGREQFAHHDRITQSERAEEFGSLVRESIRQRRSELAPEGDLLGGPEHRDSDPPAGPQYPLELAQRAERVGHEHQSELTHDRIERLAAQRQSPAVTSDNGHIGSESSLHRREHADRDVRTDDQAVRTDRGDDVGSCLARARGDVQHDIALLDPRSSHQRRHEEPGPATEVPLIRHRVDTTTTLVVVEPGPPPHATTFTAVTRCLHALSLAHDTHCRDRAPGALRSPAIPWPEVGERARATTSGRPAQEGVTFGDQVSMKRLVLRYLAMAVVALVAVALVSALVARRVGTSAAIDDADRTARLIAGSAVEPALLDSIVNLDPGATARLDGVVRGQVLGGSLLRVKLWRPDGTILYSDEPRLIGQHFELDEEEGTALRTGDSAAGITDLSEPENRYEDSATRLLEVYVPVRTPDGTDLLFEAYFRYEGVAEAGRRVWERFAPVMLGALVLVTLLQVPSAISLARRLRRTQRQREALLHSAIEATDVERRRIATDLHDGVVQDLAGVGFSLSASAREVEAAGGSGAELRRAGEQVREAVRSLRSLLVDIYPPSLTESGLEAALSDLTAQVEARGVDASLVVDGPVGGLDRDTTRLLYRTAQEGLRNVVAHAGATHVDIRVDVPTNGDGGPAVLEVADDGRGISGETVPEREGHLGLKGLAGLAATMGASLMIDTAPGRGTTLRLEVPVR
jgi:two-component system NarL family sensor kinase